METRTAEWVTWPASHCPLLGRVVPSATDVSSVAKEGGEGGGRREEKELCEPPVLCRNGLLSQEDLLPHKWTMQIYPDWWRVQVLALSLSHTVTLGLRVLQVPSMGSSADPNSNVLEFMG